jgi:N-acetylglucosamine kinase-like BadF-type ATPase
MAGYFLGVDVGSTKTHALIADDQGRVAGFGMAGPGNHENVGYAGLTAAIVTAADEALVAARISKDQIAGAGFGVAGFDWPSEKPNTLRAIGALGLAAPVEVVNDAILGLLAGSAEGWGVAVVSGTGCNCRGWTREREREGRVTGAGLRMGEGAGATELAQKAVQALAHEWTRRGPATQLTPAMIGRAGARDLGDLLEGLVNDRYTLDASAAPLVLEAAAAGDSVALGVIRWAGRELGELANAVIRQLEFEALSFDVVLVGSLFTCGAMLIEPMRETIATLAPGARLVPLATRPVVGAVLLGMEQAGVAPSASARETLARAAAGASRPT